MVSIASSSLETPRSPHLHHRPHLDGLRTIAVYLVVAFHAGLGVFTGGFIGVDIFFVLSGFLVTQVLLRDLGKNGRIRFRQFYARRVRRIVPAAVVTLIGASLAYSVVASPAEMLDARDGFRAAFLYVANWHFIDQSADYFAANVHSNPALHFWSLAVEEQFYLLWPVLLGGLYMASSYFGRRRWWMLRTTVVVAGAASAIAALQIDGSNLARAYYGTDTRAYQLFAGAALALTPQLLRLRGGRPARWVSSLAIVGLLALATSVFDFGPITRGVVVAALTVVLLVALETADGGLGKALLSTRPFTYLGRISYGVYLWHWPVIVIAAHGRTLSPIALFAISCVIATALAALSFHLIEHPIRASAVLDRYKTPLIAIGFSTSILCGIIAIPIVLDAGDGSVAAVPAGSQSGLRLLDWRVAKDDLADLPDCYKKPVTRCTVVSGTGSNVLLMGDSDARMWIPAFAEIARKRSWNLSVLSFPTCPWQRDLQVLYPTIEACRARQVDWYERAVPALDPEMVIVVHQALDVPGQRKPLVANGTNVGAQSPSFARVLTGATSASLRSLQRSGRELVILEPTPDPPPGTTPIDCLSLGREPARCAYQANRQPTPLERFFRRTAQNSSTTAIDLDRLVCPRWPTCDAIVGQIIVKADRNHLTATFARSVAQQMDELVPG